MPRFGRSGLATCRRAPTRCETVTRACGGVTSGLLACVTFRNQATIAAARHGKIWKTQLRRRQQLMWKNAAMSQLRSGSRHLFFFSFGALYFHVWLIVFSLFPSPPPQALPRKHTISIVLPSEPHQSVLEFPTPPRKKGSVGKTSLGNPSFEQTDCAKLKF